LINIGNNKPAPGNKKIVSEGQIYRYPTIGFELFSFFSSKSRRVEIANKIINSLFFGDFFNQSILLRLINMTTLCVA
jgi:hypothetical protein